MEHTVVVASRNGLAEVCPDSFQVMGLIAGPHDSFEAAPPNDLGVHPSGQVVISTADSRESSPTGGLFGLWDREIHYLDGGYVVGNGPAFSPDGSTIYVADSPRGVIYAYDFDLRGLSVANRRVFASVPSSCGFPDGLATDAEGGVWSARWGGACVVRYTPDGREDFRLVVPAQLVTSCAFGGEDLKTLYITTAQLESTDGDLGGHLFCAEAEVKGILPGLGRI